MRWVTLKSEGINYDYPFGITVDADAIVGFQCRSRHSDTMPGSGKIVAVTVAGAVFIVDEFWSPKADESWADFETRTQQRINALAAAVATRSEP